ncbi:MAG: hypothetical protein AMK73_02760 [Planctomycetes bacterium SM23_32]|nr:MAG: hypothetical protein AMK73_02760 [Planctomycetes bacterium SM23_32]
MANDEEYLSYEQVLQELKINRSQLNQLIREGRLREHLVEGETKFRQVEAQEVRKSLEKRPTVVEAEEAAEEPTTDILDEGEPPTSREPETEVLEGQPTGEPETDLLEEELATPIGERDTEILEEGPVGEEFELEEAAEEVIEPLAAAPGPSETAMETELDLQAPKAADEESSGEEFFDFSGDLGSDEFELEGPVREAPVEEEEEIVTDILDLGGEEEVPEEDLLSEIMDIEEEQAGLFGETDETEDITAEITTMEEPTYEESELGGVLEGEEAELGELEGEEFAVPYAEPLAGMEAEVGALPVVLLALSLLVMVIAALFVVENGVRPDFSTGLTSWAPFGP